jgi:AraC-like DNA-binding protein
MDLHVMGPRRRARRKDLHRGQRAITARVRMGMHEAVFGVPSSAIAGRVLALGELWDARAVDQLTERMMAARDLASAARVLESALAEQQRAAQHRHAALVLAAVARLETLRVSEVADALAVSERHLRRVFREMIGMSPKEYARLTRFHRALRVARDRAGLDWAAVAASAGYYDQAHLIGDFREIAGVTPRALLRELRAAEPIQHSTVSA